MARRRALALCSSIRFCFPKVEFRRPPVSRLVAPWPGPCNTCNPTGSWTLFSKQRLTNPLPLTPRCEETHLSRDVPPACPAPHPQRTKENTRTAPSGSGTAGRKAGEEPGSCVPLPRGRARWVLLRPQTQPDRGTEQDHHRIHPAPGKAWPRQSSCWLGAAALQMRRVWLACLLGCTCIVSVRAVARSTDGDQSRSLAGEEREKHGLGKAFVATQLFVAFWVAGWAGRQREMPLSSLANATLPANATCLPITGPQFTPRSLFTPGLSQNRKNEETDHTDPRLPIADQWMKSQRASGKRHVCFFNSLV
jgi:hypothetical protein